MIQHGGGCSICGSPNTNKSTCPDNPQSTHKANPTKHPLARGVVAASPPQARAASPPQARAASPPQAQARAASPPHKSPPWSVTDTCYHSMYYLASNRPCALFDLDETLMKLNSTIPITPVIEYALKCLEQGYYVAVLSNQYSISKGRTTHSQVQDRFKELRKILEIKPSYHVSCFYASAKDKYRKPMTGMYDLLDPDRSALPGSFYCGDSVGRQNDYAVSDLYFAKNCNLKCLSAPDLKESFIVAPKYRLYENLEPLNKWLVDPSRDTYPYMGAGQAPVLIIMVGPQGSGKSTLAQRIKSTYSEIHILNRDTLKTKLDARFDEYTKARKNIILDNTNTTLATRMKYIEPAAKLGYETYIYYFDIPKELSVHMCNMRVQLGGAYIPMVAIHTYYKNLEAPTSHEGHLTTIRGVYSLEMPPEYYYKYNLKDR